MNNPVILSAHFLPSYGYAVGLRIQSNNDSALSINIIHDSINGFAFYELTGNRTETDTLSVQDNESLVILVRDDESQIVASAVFQICTDLIESIGMVLAPISLVNIHIDQCEHAVITASLQRAIDAVFTEAPIAIEEGAQVR